MNIEQIITHNRKMDTIQQLVLLYGKEQKEQVFQDVEYFFHRYSKLITIKKSEIYGKIKELIRKRYTAEGIRQAVRTMLINNIQRNCIETGDIKRYRRFYPRTERLYLGKVRPL